MDLVDDDQVEFVSEARHVTKGAFERRYRKRLDRSLAVTQAPDWTAVHARELGHPLLEQRTGRDEAERSRPGPGEHCGGYTRLTASGWQHDDAAPPRLFPRKRCVLLVRPELDRTPRPGCGAIVGDDLVSNGKPLLSESREHVAVTKRGGSPETDAGIPEEPGDGFGPKIRRLDDDQRPVIEKQAHTAKRISDPALPGCALSPRLSSEETLDGTRRPSPEVVTARSTPRIRCAAKAFVFSDR
jgi:hypothetical protein